MRHYYLYNSDRGDHYAVGKNYKGRILLQVGADETTRSIFGETVQHRQVRIALDEEHAIHLAKMLLEKVLKHPSLTQEEELEKERGEEI